MEPRGVREFYDATAGSWAEKWYADASMLPLLERFISLCGAGSSILDAGCGAGYESKRLAELGAEVTGFDFSEASLAIARRKNPNLRFVQADCLDLPADLRFFDGIVSIALLVHIPDENLEKALGNLRMTARDGGHMLLAYVKGNGRDMGRSCAQVNGIVYDRAFYQHAPSRMIQAAKSAGWVYREDWLLQENNGAWIYSIYAAAPSQK